MRKIWLLATLLISGLLLTWCTVTFTWPEQQESLQQESEPKENIIYWQSGSQDIEEGKTVYTNTQYWFSLVFWEVYQWGFVHQEDWENLSTITFFVKDDTATKEETHIDWYRDVFVVYAIPYEKNDEFSEFVWLTEKDLIWQNDKYFLYETRGEQFEQQEYYTDNIVFPAE